MNFKLNELEREKSYELTKSLQDMQTINQEMMEGVKLEYEAKLNELNNLIEQLKIENLNLITQYEMKICENKGSFFAENEALVSLLVFNLYSGATRLLL